MELKFGALLYKLEVGTGRYLDGVSNTKLTHDVMLLVLANWTPERGLGDKYNENSS